MMRTYAGGNELLRGGSELVDLALLSARATSAVRRAVGSCDLDDRDRDALNALGDVLAESARAVDFFTQGGRAGSRPAGAMAARLDAAIDAILDDGPVPLLSAKELKDRLSSLARSLKAVATSPGPSAATVLPVIEHLARSLANRAGHIGESTAVL